MEHVQPVERYRPKQKLLLVTVLVCLFFIGVFWVVAQLLIDEDAVISKIQTQIKQETAFQMSLSLIHI